MAGADNGGLCGCFFPLSSFRAPFAVLGPSAGGVGLLLSLGAVLSRIGSKAETGSAFFTVFSRSGL